MSHPKSGRVEIRDRQLLEGARRQREEAEAKELAHLERQARREKVDDQRLADLRERDQRRRDREALREAERIRLANQQRQQEEAAYQHALANLESALHRRADLLSRFDGLQLPNAPEIMESARSDAGSTRAATTELLRSARAYQDAVDRALVAWHRKNEATISSQKAGALAARFQTRAVRNAKDVVSALDVDRPGAQAALRDARLATRAQRARELVAGFGIGTPWRDELEMSDDSLAALDEVMSATADATAQAAYFRLQNCLLADGKRAEKAHLAAEARRADAQLEKVREAQQRDRELVASTIRDTLQDLGYNVGEIENIGVAEHGTLYFSRSEWVDHAVQLQLDDEMRVHLEALRVAAEDEALGPADLTRQRAADSEFDEQFCAAAGGLGKLKSALAMHGLGMPLKADPVAPNAGMRRVADVETGGALRKAQGQRDADVPLKTQALSHSR